MARKKIQKGRKKSFSLMAYFKNNWRIPVAVITIAIVASMASAAPQILHQFTNSFTDVLLLNTEYPTLAKAGTSDADLPDAWLSEMTEHWANSAVAEAVEQGLIDGTQPAFRPDASINRAEMAMIMARVLVSEDTSWPTYTSGTFCDVSDSNWFAGAVMTIYEAGLVSGYPSDDCDGGIDFGPGKNLTRAEAMKVILRAYSDTLTVDEEGVAPFQDTSLHWAEPYLAAAYNFGIVEGYSDKTFKPDAQISRAEFIKMLVSAMDVISAQDAADDEADDYASDDSDGDGVADTTDDTDADSGSSSSPPVFNDEIPSI